MYSLTMVVISTSYCVAGMRQLHVKMKEYKWWKNNMNRTSVKLDG